MRKVVYKTKKKSFIYGWLAIFLLTIILSSCAQNNQKDFAELRKEFNKAHDAQVNGNLKNALDIYKDCVARCSQEQYEGNDSVKQMLPKAMVQLMNVYQSQGNQSECVSYFDSLKLEVDDAPTMYNKVLNTNFKRDVYVLLAYSLSRTDEEKRGVQVMDEALEMPLYDPTHERLFRDYAYATGVYYCVPTTQAKVFEYGRKALDEVKYCQVKSGAQWLVTLLGSMYQRIGKVDEAISMYQEGYELAATAQDTLGMANAQKEMADYLLQWNLDSIADRFASQAVKLVIQVADCNPMVKTGIFVTKARILQKFHKKKAALDYLRLAKEACSGMPYNSGASDIGVLMGSLLITQDAPCYSGDFEQGMAMLKSATLDATYKIKATAFFEIAKADLKLGKKGEGEAALDSMYAILNASQTPVVIEGAYDYALKYYRQTDNQAKAAFYAKALQKENAELGHSVSTVDVVAAVGRMESGEHLLDVQGEVTGRRKMIGVLVGGVLLLALVGVGGWYIFKNKKRKSKYKYHSDEKGKTELVTDGKALLTILKTEGEEKFRSCFKKAYPGFMDALKVQVPSLTHKEEIHCMLMALGADNAELSSALSITRQSVNIVKSRIRKKLPEEVDGSGLELFLKNLLGNDK